MSQLAVNIGLHWKHAERVEAKFNQGSDHHTWLDLIAHAKDGERQLFTIHITPDQAVALGEAIIQAVNPMYTKTILSDTQAAALVDKVLAHLDRTAL